MPSRITFEEFLEFCNNFPEKADDIGEIKGDMLIRDFLFDKGKADDIHFFLGDLKERYGETPLMDFSNRHINEITIGEIFESIQEINNRPRKMTLDEFLIFCKNSKLFKKGIEKVESDALVTDIVGDGKDLDLFFWVIQIEFEVSFDNFDYKRYFHLEIEILIISLLTLGGLLKKPNCSSGIFRRVEKISIAEFFGYMQEFRKDKPRKMIFEEFLNFCENSKWLRKGINKVKGDDLVTDLFDDGLYAKSFLCAIEIEFGVTFKNFDYGKYFRQVLVFEGLIYFVTLGYLFGLLGFYRKRVRKLFRRKEQITIAGLFDYMQKNIVEV